MNRILVTGATGFVGQNLVAQLLQQGHQVRCLVRKSSHVEPLREQGAELLVGDVCDPESLPAAMEQAEVVYHLAGKVHAWSKSDFDRVNVQGTENVLQAAADRTSPPVVVAVSSLAAAGPGTAQNPRTEDQEESPVSNYGRSKLAGESAVARWANKVPVSIVRPPAIFGPHDRDGLVMFRAIKTMRTHVVPCMFDLPMSLIHVDDLAAALQLVAANGKRLEPNNDSTNRTGIYFAADAEPSSYGMMGQMAAKAMGQRMLTIRVPKFVFAVPALAGEVAGRLRRKPPLIGIDKFREARAAGWVCATDRIEKELGFQPAATLQQRYNETAEWYRENQWI